MTRPIAALALTALLLLPACTTLADAVDARGTGTRQEFAPAPDRMFAVVVTALDRAGLEVVSADRATGTILAQRRATWPGDDGENVAVFVQPAPGGRTAVEVVGKRATTTQVWNGTSEAKIMRAIAEGLAG